MNTLRWIVWKDLARFAADRNGAFLTILTPVAMAALLSVLFAPKEKATEVELLVADLDQSVASAALVKAIDDADALKVVQVDLEEARHRLERGKASVALVLPKGAGEQLSASKLFSGGKSLSLPLLYDPADGVEAGLAEGLVTKAVMTHLAQAFTDPKQLVTMDYDGDGDQDLIIVNNASGPVVYRNESRQDAWLRVRLVGRAPNTEALGARVWAQGADGRRQVRAIGAQSYYLGQSERVAHFGLGRAQWASVDIRWPDGAEQRVDCLRARQEVRLVQGEPFEGDCAPGEIDALVEDAAVDAALDEGLDLGLDGALDGGLDAGVDAADADLDASVATDADLDAAEVLDQGVVAPDRAVDAAPDRAVDVAPDRAVDAAPDRAVDAVPDRAVDVAADRAVDAAPDRAVDATPDRAVDVAPDRAVDAARPADRGIDARLDASPDARPDARDVSADRATDAPIEDARPQPDRPVYAATVDAAPVDAASPENIAGSSGCDCRAGGHTGNPGGRMFWWLFLPLLRRRR